MALGDATPAGLTAHVTACCIGQNVSQQIPLIVCIYLLYAPRRQPHFCWAQAPINTGAVAELHTNALQIGQGTAADSRHSWLGHDYCVLHHAEVSAPWASYSCTDWPRYGRLWLFAKNVMPST